MARAAAQKVASQREPLSRERIEIASLDLIEQEGLAGFSIRKLAAALGCEAMSIYHYFPSKGHLMDALIDHVVAEVAPMPSRALPWIERLRRWGRDVRRAFTKRPSLYLFVATHRMNTRKGLRLLDDVMGFMMESGLPEDVSVRLFRSISYYITGAGLDETAGYSRGPSTVDPVPEDELRREYPSVATAGQYFRPDQFDATFDLGWEVMLEGVERLRARYGVS